MDPTKPKVIKKTIRMERITENVEMGPNGSLFNDAFPTEMKDTILSYLCDCDAFVAAAVCQEWRAISVIRFNKEEVVIGEVWSRCEENCGKTALENMLKAAAAHKLDVHLVICQPVTQIDKEFVTDALTSVSNFTVVNDYVDDRKYLPILSTGQFEHLFESIEKREKIMEEVKLMQLKETLKDIDKEKLANFLISKVKRLTLDDVSFVDDGTFIRKLQDSSNVKLTHLTLDDVGFFSYAHENPTVVADALCKVKNVKLCGRTFISLTNQVMGRLIENILQKPIMMKTLIISIENNEDLRHEDVTEGLHYESLINPQDLKTLFSKMEALSLEGFFTPEQLEAVKSLTDVHVEVNRIQIENNQDFYHSLDKFSSHDLVYEWIRQSMDEAGLHKDQLYAQIKANMSRSQMETSLEFLCDEGRIYSTVDEDHFQVTDDLGEC